MNSILIMIFVSLAIASVLNIVLKKFSVSHVVGYIVTGTIISNLFDFNGSKNMSSLDLIGEFGIVFLMFTIGLEMSFRKLKNMKEVIFFNGAVQVCLSASIILLIAYYLFNLNFVPSLIIALAFSLSSTAIVLTYLKKSKDVVTPYGDKTVAVLIFQDLAVIPILLLVSFLSDRELSIVEVLIKTSISAFVVIIFMFTLGKKLITTLLSFSASARLEELFLGSVLTIVIGASILAHEMGFTYSLGAFIAGMIIAETHFHVKVESDISSYKDLLLGAFFFSIGAKIDVNYFLSNLHIVFSILVLTMLIKVLIVFFLMRIRSNKSDSIKSSLALCQVGEFSFAIFIMAINDGVISDEMGGFLILVVVLSMIITPFMVNNIYKIASFFVVEFFESDKITPVQVSRHTIICGYAEVGRLVAKELEEKGVSFLIISDNLQHVLLAREEGYMAFFGHFEKAPVLESLKVDQSASIVVTVNTLLAKRIICEAVLDGYPDANIIVTINTAEEKNTLENLGVKSFVHAEREIAELLVQKSIASVIQS